MEFVHGFEIQPVREMAELIVNLRHITYLFIFIVSNKIFRAVLLFIIGVISLLGICSYCGMLIYASYHTCDPLTTQLARAKDQLLPLYVMDVLGELPGLPGLFVAGVFSAALR